MAFRVQTYWLTPLLALLLQACGGGSGEGDDSGNFTPSRPAAGTVVSQIPGTSQLNLLSVQAVDFPDRDLPETAISAGTATPLLPDDLADQLLVLRAGKVNEEARLAAQQEGTSIDTPHGSPATHYGHLLLTGRQLQQFGAILNPLSDYIGRRTDDYVELQTNERIRHYQDAMAMQFIRSDLTGDGLVNYDDALAFNPESKPHLQRLSFDYLSAMRSPLSGGMTLEQTYIQAPEQLDAALLEAFEPYESVSPPSRSRATLGSLHIDVDAGGSITIAELPQVTLNDSNPRMIHRFERHAAAPATFTLSAVADEGWQFVRWTACPELLSDNRCRIVANQELEVGAQFGLLENDLADGIDAVIELDRQPGNYSMVRNGSEVTISNVSSAAVRAALDAATPQTVLASMGSYPLQRITAIHSSSAGTWRFQVDDVMPADVYSAVTAFDSGEMATFDEIESVSIEVDGQADPSQPALRTASARGTSSHSGRQVQWIPGMGRAISAGHGYYLVDAGTQGFQLVRSTGQVSVATGRAAVQGLAQSCAQNPLAPDCKALASAARSPQIANCTILSELISNSSIDCNVNLLKIEFKDDLLMGSFSLEGSLSVTPYGSTSLRWMPLPVFPFAAVDISGNARGVVDLTIGAKAFAGLGGEQQAFKSVATPKIDGTLFWSSLMWLPSSSYSGLELASMSKGYGHVPPISGLDDAAAQMKDGTSSAPAELKRFSAVTTDKKSLLTITLLLNRASPAGVVFPVKLKAGIVATAKGSIGLELQAAERVRFFYDMDINLGARCKKVLKVTACYGIKIPQRASGKTKVRHYQKFSASVLANGEFAPGIQLAVTAGPRGIAEELLEASAGVSVPFYAVVNEFKFETSNFPEDELKQLNPACSNTGASAAFGVNLKLEAGAKLKPGVDLHLAGKKVKISFLPEVNIFSADYTRPLIPASLRRFTKAGSSPSIECLPVDLRPASSLPATYSWIPGELNWEQLTQVVVKDYKLIREDNGNLVLYYLKRNAEGQLTAQEKVWDAGIKDHPGSRISFEKTKGQLVFYTLREEVKAQWPSNSALKKTQGAKLLLSAAGLEIWSAENKRLWRAGK